MEKAITNITRFFVNEDVHFMIDCFNIIQGLKGANRIFKHIAKTNDKEQIEDYFAEIKFALVFKGLGYSLEFEPLGRKGPDLGISRNGDKITVEVTRFRKMFPGPPATDSSNDMESYGNIKRDTKKAFRKIIKKFSQTSSYDSIIALWNDDEDLEEIEVGEAVNDLCKDKNKNNISIPDELSFVIYVSKWVNVRLNQQIYCFPLHSSLSENNKKLMNDLEKSRVSYLINSALNR